MTSAQPPVEIVDDSDDAPETQRAPEPPKKLRGFAVVKARGGDVRAIASLGGKAAHANGTAHRWTREEATEAGRRGGMAPHRSRGRARP